MVKRFYKNNPLVCLIAILLFLIPFFWFSFGEADYGGDSSRLYFFDPNSWFRNIAFYSPNNLSSFGFDNPNYSLIPFLFLLTVIRLLVFGNTYFLNCAFSGLLLSGSFLFTYLSAIELFALEENKEMKTAAIIGGLFFSFSPLIIYGWQRALYSINEIFIYPLVFFLLVKYLQTFNKAFLLLAAAASFVFSVNFSYGTAPWFFSFFFFSFLFLLAYSIITKKTKLFLKGIFFFGFLFLSIQSFQLVPQFINIFSFSNPNSLAVFSGELAASRGLEYFLSIQTYVRLTYNFLNQAQLHLPMGDGAYEYGLKFRALYYVYLLVIIFAGLIIKKFSSDKEKKIYAILMPIFLALCFFMTANITKYLAEFYKSLFKIPMFSMYRSFYTKFAAAYVFYFSLLLVFSLASLFKYFNFKRLKLLASIFLLGLIVFNGWPLISGRIVNTTLWQSKNVRVPTKIDLQYYEFLDGIKTRELNAKFLSMPLTFEEYQLVKGENGGAYFGPSTIAILAGKNDFNGLNTFRAFQPEIERALATKNWDLWKKYLQGLNIRYIFHNADNYIYDNFPTLPYPLLIKDAFKDQQSISDFISLLGYERLAKIGNFNLYFQDDNFLPLFYLADDIYEVDGGTEMMSEIYGQLDYQSRSAVYFRQQNRMKLDSLVNLGFIKDKGTGSFYKTAHLSEDIWSEPVLEYKMINPTKYRVVIHKAKDLQNIVFLNSFDEKWQAYLKKYVENDKDVNLKLVKNHYKILENNNADQASSEEVENYFNQGWISTLGNLQPKTRIHKRYEGLQEKVDHKETYEINFISKNFLGTIQNNNLVDGELAETWFNKENLLLIPQKQHFMVNGYANSWVVEVSELCRQGGFCIKNKDGTYDLEIVFEFTAQKIFILFFLISLLTFTACLSLAAVFLFSRLSRHRQSEVGQNAK